MTSPSGPTPSPNPPRLPVVRIQWAQSLYSAHHPGEALAVLQRTLVDTRPDEADRERIQATITDWTRARVN